MLLHAGGSVPVSLFERRSKFVKFTSEPHEAGKVPWIALLVERMSVMNAPVQLTPQLVMHTDEGYGKVKLQPFQKSTSS